MQQQIQHNYDRTKSEVRQNIAVENERIKNDPELRHLLSENGEMSIWIGRFRN
jgi:hypothetical protein